MEYYGDQLINGGLSVDKSNGGNNFPTPYSSASQYCIPQIREKFSIFRILHDNNEKKKKKIKENTSKINSVDDINEKKSGNTEDIGVTINTGGDGDVQDELTAKAIRIHENYEKFKKTLYFCEHFLLMNCR